MAVQKNPTKMDKITQFSQKITKTANFMNFRYFIEEKIFLMKIQIVGSQRVIVQKERENMH